MKSAQAAWTQSVVNNVIGHIIHVDKSTCIAMFPKADACRSFDREKFSPMIQSTPELAAVMPIKSRAKDVTAMFKQFSGGYVKFVGSNSISDLKGSSARRLIVEEPDDCNLNLRGQGDAIKLIEERGKTFRDVKLLIGGTPSIAGVSSIQDEMLHSDQNRWMVPCWECGEHQALEWEQVRWLDNAETLHAIFGAANSKSARYACAHCGSLWDDAKKNFAVRHGHAEPQSEFRGVLGLYINELYAPWHESRMQNLVERYLSAKHEEAKGNIEALIVFWNAALGRAWEYKGNTADEAVLEARGLDYAVNTVPAGGLILTMGVDVQHNRLAIIIRAWGRGEESWLVLFDEIDGNTVDKNDDVWKRLDDILFGEYRHAWGVPLRIKSVSLDSSDGTSSDAVYSYVRSRAGRGVEVMAIKGSSTADAEIFRRQPATIDSNYKNTKASKYGLRTFSVGVSRAKDLLLGDKGPGRIALEGEGAGRVHWYRDVRADYLRQFLSEVKVPVRGGGKGRRVWQIKKGQRNEVLDAEIYALHAARALKLNLARDAQWAAIEAQMRQHALFATEEIKVAEVAAGVEEEQPEADAVTPKAPAPVPDMPPGFRVKPRGVGGRGNWVSNY